MYQLRHITVAQAAQALKRCLSASVQASAFALVAEPQRSSKGQRAKRKRSLRNSGASAMSALLDALRWPNCIAEDESAQMGTEGKARIPRFTGEPTRLTEYVFRVKAKQLKEKALADDERKKLGPLALRLVEGLSGTSRGPQRHSLACGPNHGLQ